MKSTYTNHSVEPNNILVYLDRLRHFAKLQLNLLKKKSKRRNGVNKNK